MKYVQSFWPYPVTYSSTGKTIPSMDADGETRNIVEVDEKDLEKMQAQEPLFRQLLNLKKYRVLDKLPASYRPAATLVNEANERATKAEAELAALKEKMGAADKPAETGGNPEEGAAEDLEKMDYKALQEKAKALGIEDVNVKKAALIEAIKEAQSKE